MDGTHVETVFGKHHRYDIRRKERILAATSYLIYRDGKYWTSSNSLNEAVNKARDAG